MHDGLHSIARHFGRRINVRDEPDDRRLLTAGRSRYRGHHVAMLVYRRVVQSKCFELGDELARQHQLTRRAGECRGVFVRPRVERDVPEKTAERGRGHMESGPSIGATPAANAGGVLATPFDVSCRASTISTLAVQPARPSAGSLSRVAKVPGTPKRKATIPASSQGEWQNAKLNAGSTNRIQKRPKWLQI